MKTKKHRVNHVAASTPAQYHKLLVYTGLGMLNSTLIYTEGEKIY